MWFYVWFSKTQNFLIHSYRTANKEYKRSLKKFGANNEMEINSAFSVAELLVMLEEDIFTKSENAFSLASILADLLIERIENKVLSIDSVNERILRNHYLEQA